MGTLIALVVLHLIVSVVHGAAHSGAQVALPLAGALFVYIVILAGPLVGLIVAHRRPSSGAAIVALTMAGAFAFGVVNHFIIPGSDHVTHVARDWRFAFGSTAVLLAVLEAATAAVATRLAVRRPRRSS
jgi:hypothetical protein